MKMGLRELTSHLFLNPVISILLFAMADSFFCRPCGAAGALFLF
jgi:hypothetical protein